MEIGWIFINLIEKVTDQRLLLQMLSIHGFYDLFILFFDFDRIDFVCNLLDSVYRLIEFDNTTFKQFKIVEKLQELDIDNLLCAIELSVDDERKNILMRLSKIKSIHKYETNHQLL